MNEAIWLPIPGRKLQELHYRCWNCHLSGPALSFTALAQETDHTWLYLCQECGADNELVQRLEGRGWWVV